METREAVKKHLSVERLHKLSLLLPYELLPQKFEEEDLDTKLKKVQDVSFIYKTRDGRSIEFTWDKEIHKLKIDLPYMMEEFKIPSDEEDILKEKLKEAFDKKREEITKEHEAKKKILDSYSPEHIQALKDIKIYKFYPTHPRLDISGAINPYFNRYFGNVDRVFS